MKEGWEIKKLGEVANIIYGYTEKASYAKIGPKFLRITDIQDNGVEWDSVPYCSISESEFEKYKLSDGDIVFARTGATTGKSYLLSNPPKSVFASYLIKVHINNGELLPEYLYFFFQTNIYWERIYEGISGSAQGGFNASKLSELQIPLPPLPEQRRIVSFLDEALAAITIVKANAEQNLKNARELFDSYLQSVFLNNGKEWEEKTLREVCEIKPPKNEARNKLHKTDLVSFVPMEDLGINQKFFTPTKQKQLSQVEGSYTYFAEGDILIAKITPCFENGKLGIARSLINGIGFGSSEFIVFRVSKNLFSEFLYFFLLRKSFRAEGAERMTGAVGHKRVTKEFIYNYRLPMPPLNEQRSIVEKLDSLSIEIEKLDAIYQKKLNNLDVLKKSILQKAFKGELNTDKALVV